MEDQDRYQQSIELLQELRVALPGVQVMFAFLLALPFSARFEVLSGDALTAYAVAIISSVVAIGCLIAPSIHNHLNRSGKPIQRNATKFVVVGVSGLATAISSSMYVVSSVLYGSPVPGVIGGLTLIGLLAVWFGYPFVTDDETSA